MKSSVLFAALVSSKHRSSLISTINYFSFPGYEISTEAMRILFNRFAKKRSYMNIDDFSACLSRVKIMDGG